MKQIIVKASQVKAALEGAATQSQQWQAGLLEMLVEIPALRQRWMELNSNYSYLTIRRHPGQDYLGYTPEDNRAVEDWSAIMGYTFWMAEIAYNRVRTDGYMHSAGCTWDGVQRRTRCAFLDMLRMLTLAAMGEIEVNRYASSVLSEAAVEFVDDLLDPLWSVYVESKNEPGTWYLRKRKASRVIALREAARFAGERWNLNATVVPYNRELGASDELTELPVGAKTIQGEHHATQF